MSRDKEMERIDLAYAAGIIDGEGYQLLCANCNWIKRYEQAEQN